VSVTCRARAVRYPRVTEDSVITYVESDLFDSPAQVLVNTVNTVGVMGKGIARRFKRAFPEMFCEYQTLCEAGQLTIGRLWLYRGSDRWILNFPTKKHWRNPSQPEYIEAGLQRFLEMYSETGISQIAFPQLGCGNGELDWATQVRPLMEKYLAKLSIDIFVHLYRSVDTPEHRNPAATKRWLRLEVESLAFVEVWDDIIEIVRKRDGFRTLTDKSFFRVTISDTGGEGICFDTDTGQFTIPPESILEFWQQLRTYGYVTPGVLDADLEAYFHYLVALFAELPYVRTVRLGHDPAMLDRPTALGLQWAPRVQTKRRAATQEEQVVQLQFA